MCWLDGTTGSQLLPGLFASGLVQYVLVVENEITDFGRGFCDP
jgi:hypothetical protein